MSAELLADLRATTRSALNSGSFDVVDELDLAGLLVDADRGGLGMGESEMILVATELGRALSPSSFLPNVVLAVTLLAHAETDAATKILAAVAEGRSRCAVAVAEVDAPWLPPQPAVAATQRSDGGWLLSGTVWGLSTPTAPDTVLVVAGADGEAALFAAATRDADVTHADELDPSRRLVRIALGDAAAQRLSDGDGTGAIAEAYRRGLLAVGAEQAGVARNCLEEAVAYAKSRSQFGSPIGSFQAIKHRCAEVLLDVELADAVIEQAIQTGAAADAELAFVVATRAALSAAESSIHIHGGIGFTWEHRAHRYLRRARVNATLLGPMTFHRDAVAASAGLTTAEGDAK